MIKIDTSRQELYLLKNNNLIKSYVISSAENGLGEQENSFKTPRGLHKIYAKYGHDAQIGSIFVGRIFTGEIISDELMLKNPDRDWILTRIIWLDGLDDGKNKGPGIDSKERLIYIHGTPDSYPMGVPYSKGCIRMRNSDLIELFDLVEPETLVLIF